METKVKTEVLTNTRTATAVFIITGVISGFFAGMFFASVLISQPASTQSQNTVQSTNYFTLGDISFADWTIDHSSTSESFTEVKFYGLPGGASIGEDAYFGKFSTSQPEFQDGQTYTNPWRLKVAIDSTIHPAMFITLRYSGSLPASNQTSRIELIKKASAQVITGERKVICIPEKATANPLSFQSSDSKLFGLIHAAQAQADTNTNQNTNSEPPAYTYYYFDINGNAYWDEDLTQRVSAADCQTLVAKNYSPTEISGVTLAGQVSLPDQINFTLAKSWNTVYGYYNPVLGWQSGGTVDLIDHGSPLFVLGANNEDTPTAYARFNLSVQTPNGLKSLCMPARTIDAHGWFVQFYDTNGKAYSDLFLTQPLNCNSTPNNCTNISCKKYPNHPCCLAAPANNTPASQ
ncbi:MAG: hypothetical protein WCV50_06130 [Patescibacteria group bacterium]|jgi:hypothetical protein